MGFYKICGYSQQQIMALLYALGDQGKNPVSFLDNCRSRLGNSVFSKKADNVTSLEQRAKPMKQTPNCCICGNLVEVKMHEGKVYWNQGENALPVKDGRCCLKCNWEIVVPARLNKANDEFDNLV